MAEQPDLQFRRLEGGEMDLAEELAESLRRVDPAASAGEVFGHEAGTTGFRGHGQWGVFVRGDLVGAAWLAQGRGSEAEIVCLAMARGWWRTGLAGWLLEGLAKAARLAGAAGTIVRIRNGGPALGEVLLDAGFSGPDPEADDFPAGVWRSGGRGAATP